MKVTIGSPHGVGKPCSTFSIAAAWLRGAGHAVGTKPRIYTGLLADGAQASSACETRLKAQGPREDIGLPHFSESKNGMTT